MYIIRIILIDDIEKFAIDWHASKKKYMPDVETM